MNTLKNQVQLIGNVGVNPESKTFESGKKVVRFSLATNDTYKNQGGEKVTNTDWHNIEAWGNTAAIIEKHVKKGDQLVVTGKITYNKYEDKDGNKRSKTIIVCNEVLFMSNSTKTNQEEE